MYNNLPSVREVSSLNNSKDNVSTFASVYFLSCSEEVITYSSTTTQEFKVREPGWEIPSEFSTVDFEYGTVALNTEKTDEIRSLGYAREVVRRIQQMRKGEDLDIEAFIEANVETTPEIAMLLEMERDYISTETRAKTLNMGSEVEHKGTEKEWNINKNPFKISISNI